MQSRKRFEFRSDGGLKNASAMNIVAREGNVGTVKSVAKKVCALGVSGVTTLGLASEELVAKRDMQCRKWVKIYFER